MFFRAGEQKRRRNYSKIQQHQTDSFHNVAFAQFWTFINMFGKRVVLKIPTDDSTVEQKRGTVPINH